MAELPLKRVVVGISAGIAAYKSAELVRLLVKDGLDVQVVMTQAASSLIAPATMQALSGNPVFTDLWDARIRDNMAHIELSRARELIVVAPATADFLAKVANGLADDLLSTLCIARECTLMVAPAMNRQMWSNRATQRNMAQLERDGVVVLGPASGDQACGETGLGRMLEPAQIYEAVISQMQPRLLAGKQVVVTAGPTFEPIDAVRGITNRSSGKMGYAVARAALEAGADVTLISGPTSLVAPTTARLVSVESAAEMFAMVKKHVTRADIFIGVAAVADYHVQRPSTRKIPKSQSGLNLKLVTNPDILAWVASQPQRPFCVGFAAESHDLNKHAEEKRRRKKLPLLAANLAQDAVGADDNELTLFDDTGTHKLARASKTVLARQLVAHIAKLEKNWRAASRRKGRTRT